MRNEYLEDTRYARYLIEMTAEEEKLHGFTEALIGVHEGASLEQLMAIREGVSDKINNVWEKFKAFLAKVYAKFINYANKAILNQVEYLERYKDIILNRKPNDFPFEMTDYPTGIRQLTQVVIPVFKTVIDKVTTEPTDTSFMESLIPGYDGKTPWPTFCVQHFEGGTVQKPANLRDMNMTDLYNYCHDFKSTILPAIEKDQKTLAGTLDSIRGDITSATQAAAASTTATPAQGGTTATTTTASGQGSATAATPTAHGESFIDDTFRSFFIEAMTIGNKNDNGNAANTDRSAPTGTQTAGNSAVTNQSSTKLGSSTGTNTGASSLQKTSDDKGNDTSGKVDTANKDSEALKTLEDKLKNYDTAAAGILTGKLQASQNIFNDYMKLIKIHIQQQTGQAGTNQAASNGTNTNQGLNLKSLGNDFLKTADLINKNQQPYDNAQTKADAIKKYITAVQQDNPNFKGNFADICKAAASQQAAQNQAAK